MDTIKTGLGKDIDDAIAELYKNYDNRLIEWFGHLWDGGIGGFYYSSSARDHEGFLPDVESTCQALGCLGAVCDVSKWGSLQNALPDSVKEGIKRFFCSLLDEDGYVYHPLLGCRNAHGRCKNRRAVLDAYLFQRVSLLR